MISSIGVSVSMSIVTDSLPALVSSSCTLGGPGGGALADARPTRQRSTPCVGRLQPGPTSLSTSLKCANFTSPGVLASHLNGRHGCRARNGDLPTGQEVSLSSSGGTLNWVMYIPKAALGRRRGATNGTGCTMESPSLGAAHKCLFRFWCVHHARPCRCTRISVTGAEARHQ